MTQMNPRCNKRRAAVVAAMTTAMATTNNSSMSATAFTTVDTYAPSFSSATIRPRVLSSTKLFAAEPIPTIDDENHRDTLRPPASPDRPVLVDAFAPCCGPCKLLDKVLKKARPGYVDRVDFCRWNVTDKEGTAALKALFLESEFKLTKLPSLIVFKGGKPIAMREGMANEFQLDSFLEKSLPELERTFDENGLKMVPLPRPEEAMMATRKVEEAKKTLAAAKSTEVVAEDPKETAVASVQQEIQQAIETGVKFEEGDCTEPAECWERVEKTFWQNRTVVPAMDGIALPMRSYGSP